MKQANSTKDKGGTVTSAGFIPYLQWRGIELPVKLNVEGGYRGASRLQEPVYYKDGYVYALPGGGEYRES